MIDGDMNNERPRRMFHDCAAHKPECPVHNHPELPTGCTCPAYSHPLCIFNYCPDPEFCKVPGVGCVSHSQDAAKKRLEEQGGTECVEPPIDREQHLRELIAHWRDGAKNLEIRMTAREVLTGCADDLELALFSTEEKKS